MSGTRWPRLRRPVLGIVLILAAGSGLWWGAKLLDLELTPPVAVRLLPAGESLFYLDLAHMRQALQSPLPSPPDPEYAAFVRQSGFQFERDLDAIGLSLQGQPEDPDQATAVLTGDFPAGLLAYFRAHSRRSDSVGGQPVFQFPGWSHPDRPISVLWLNNHTLIATNGADLGAMVARSRQWWPSASDLWNVRLGHRRPLSLLAIDTLRLGDEHRLGDWQGALQGANLIEGRVTAANAHAVLVTLSAEAHGAEASSNLETWARTEINLWQTVLPAGSQLRQLLAQAQILRNQNQVRLELRVDAAQLKTSSN